ncbi:MAG: hypothetical protein ACFFC3_02780 [Candidatus Odinarchaeota archaeon]
MNPYSNQIQCIIQETRNGSDLETWEKVEEIYKKYNEIEAK